MYYLISTEYVGPNERDSRGYLRGDTKVMSIYQTPGRTNLSHQVQVDGWLGTTNDVCSTAHGEFDTLEEAREEANRLGFTEPPNGDDDDMDDDDILEQWVRPEAKCAIWEADDWFGSFSDRELADMYNITAKTTDEELDQVVAEVEQEAEADLDCDGNRVSLYGCLEYFQRIRDKLRTDDEDDD